MWTLWIWWFFFWSFFLKIDFNEWFFLILMTNRISQLRCCWPTLTLYIYFVCNWFCVYLQEERYIHKNIWKRDIECHGFGIQYSISMHIHVYAHKIQWQIVRRLIWSTHPIDYYHCFSTTKKYEIFFSLLQSRFIWKQHVKKTKFAIRKKIEQWWWWWVPSTFIMFFFYLSITIIIISLH